MAEDGDGGGREEKKKREGLVEWRSGAREVKVVRKRGEEDSVGGSLGGRGGALDRSRCWNGGGKGGAIVVL